LSDFPISEKGGDAVMALEEKPFKNREDVKHEVKLCSSVATVFQILSLLFAIVGIIGDALIRLWVWKRCLGSCWQ
jgi:hypothetical protein